MDVPAYYDAHSAMNAYHSALVEPSYEACDSPFYPYMGPSSGHEDLSYLPQWSDGIDGRASANPDSSKELYGAL